MSDSESDDEITGPVTEDEILKELEANEKARDELYQLEATSLAARAANVLGSKADKNACYMYLLDNQLFYFDIHEIPNDSTIILCGRRRTGKSYLARWILYNKRKVYPFGMVMTQTKYNKYWTDYVHKDSVWGDYSAIALGRLVQRQAALAENNSHGVDPRVFIVLDDLAADTQLRNDYMLRSFFYYGRHLKAFVLVTSQWFKALAPGCRENADYIFLFGMTNVNELEAIWEEYGAGVPRDIFTQLVSRYATDSSCFVIYPHGHTPLERFFQYRAQDPGPFRMGCPEVWQAK